MAQKLVKPYRKNVGIVVFNRQGLVLVGERVDYPGFFQLPQGGIDDGEEPLPAARRELYEEVGLQLDDDPVGELTDWLKYDFPPDIGGYLKNYQGQAQKWFFFFWDGDLDKLKLDLHQREFAAISWQSLPEVSEKIVEFKREVYRKLCEAGVEIIENHLKLIKNSDDSEKNSL